jgi:predicted phosphoribosyltransferase
VIAVWHDRAEAGRELAAELERRGYGGRENVVVLGIPRGGVEVAREVADRLRAPLDVVVVRKVGAPGAPEFAAGAVDLDGGVYENPDARISREWLERAAVPEQAEVARRALAYRSGRGPLDVADCIVIVVDDGIATGLTAVAALHWLSGRRATRRVIAAPVMAPDTALRLAREADEVVALSCPAGFAAVGEYYGRFPQLSDEDVTRLLMLR